jgi:membrane protease YdiL (CAAX protease family)
MDTTPQMVDTRRTGHDGTVEAAVALGAQPSDETAVLLVDRSPARGWRQLAVLALVPLAAAEVMTVFVDPQAGLLVYCALLILFLLHAGFRWDLPIGRLALGLALLPLLRLLTLALPLAGFPYATWYLITSLPLAVATFLAARQMGLRANLRAAASGLQIPIATTGLAVGYLAYRIERPAPILPLHAPRAWMVTVIAGLLLAGAVEELIYRGIIQHAAEGLFGRLAVLYGAGLYTLMLAGQQSPQILALGFVVSLFFGWAALRTRSVLGVCVAHGLANVMLVLLLPLWYAG